MDGIVTILEDKYFHAVQEIWRDLQRTCGVRGVEGLEVPHFSWHVAQAYPDEERLDALLEQESLSIKPFSVRTTGLGIFLQPRLVIYIALAKTPALIQVHQKLWDALNSLSELPSPYYAPDLWTPHITLVYGELTDSQLGCVLTDLSRRSLDWDISIDNLALIGPTQNELQPACIQHALRGVSQDEAGLAER